MKLLFLHLSDLHYLNNDSFNNQKINLMNKTITNFCHKEEIEEAIIVFSGDLSMSGKKEQFDGVKKIVGKLIGNLKEAIGKKKHVYFFVVPGNHDIDFNNIFYTRDYIRKCMQDNFNNITNDFLKNLSNFFEYANCNNCFIKDKFIDSQIVRFNDFTIKVNLINTALFSVYDQADGADYDNGLHHLNENVINNIRNKEQGNLNITMMHHSPDFFDEKSKKILNKFLKENNDILFYGHEHNNHDELLLVNGNTTKFILGGPLSENNISNFNCIVYDTETHKIKNFKYLWNEKQKVYDEEENERVDKINNSSKNIKYNFFKEIQQDNLFNLDNFNDIYVFPELSYCDNDEKGKISDFFALEKVINNNLFCIIEGDNNIGKTTLSKYLFLKFMDNNIPVIFNSQNIKNEKINKIIKKVYELEYDKTKFSFSSFELEEKKKKIAIIDDADKIDDTHFDTLIKELKKNFGKIVIFKNINSQYDLISIAKKCALETESTIRLKIENIHYNKRLELLRKVCKYFNPHLNDKKLENNINLINKLIINQINFFQLTPSFIVLFAKSALNNTTYEYGSGKVFNDVFHSNLTNIIRTDPSLDVSITMHLLQRIAYYIHKNREYPLSQTSFVKIVDEYNKECQKYRPLINPNEFLNKLVKIRLLCYCDSCGNIKFCYNSYLSFFVAKETLRQMDNDVIMDIINHIHRGINGDILLFMCYLDENKQSNILNYIINESEKFFDKQTELDLNNINIKYLTIKQNEITIDMPSNKDKEKNKQLKDENEINKLENDRLTITDIYDYDSVIDEFQKYVMTGMKYIEIISKLLPDFLHLLDTQECETIVNAIYTYPNKFLFKVLDNVDDNIQKFEKEITSNNLTDDYKIESLKIKNFIAYLQRLSMLLILQVYKIVARYATAENTKKALGQFEFNKNISYRIINSLFYDQLGETQVLGEKLIAIYNESNKEIIKNICKIIFHNHCLNNQVNYVKENQKYVDKFLNVKKTDLAKIRLNIKK